MSTHVLEVRLERENEKYSLSQEFSGDAVLCEFYRITLPPRASNAAECITQVKGPYLYSLPGLETAFGVKGAGEARPSAVYLGTYWDAVYCFRVCERYKPQY
ncbi:MAG: hypothetical protein QXM53_06570 [Thermofilaceae archaeon]